MNEMGTEPQTEPVKSSDMSNPPSANKLPYQVLGQWLGFTDLDQERWWLNTAPFLGNLLIQSGYDVHEQYQYLAFYLKNVLPVLGSYIQPGVEAQWNSSFTSEGHPLEVSVNLQDSKAVVRLGFEPLSSVAGTDHDPLNQFMGREYLGQMARQHPCIDLRWFNHFDYELGFSVEDARSIAGNIPKEGKAQRAVGFDMKNGGIVPKGYFFPEHKSRMTNIPTATLAFGAIRKLNEGDQLTEAVNKLEEFLAPCSNTDVIILAMDCLAPSQSRIKVYVADTHVTWTRVKELWTLGGVLNDSSTLKGLSTLEGVWNALGMVDSISSIRDYDRLPLIFNYEFKLGEPDPRAQVYIPLHGDTDDAVADKLTKVFEYLKWNKLSVRYKNDLASNFPYKNLKQTMNMHRWLSFSYSEKLGVYMSVYYHTGHLSTL